MKQFFKDLAVVLVVILIGSWAAAGHGMLALIGNLVVIGGHYRLVRLVLDTLRYSDSFIGVSIRIVQRIRRAFSAFEKKTRP